MNFKKDNFVIGFVPGLFIPFILLFVLYFIMFNTLAFNTYLQQIIQHALFGKIISLGAIPNLLLFFIYIWLNKNNAARGVLGATFVIAFIMILFKFVF